ncbi:hypothetical protein FACS1894125_6480 [Actinomycetota bacterium]|nr:hypothetical protein FACS1894125_6480 [Actinomycetota bacterium]
MKENSITKKVVALVATFVIGFLTFCVNANLAHGDELSSDSSNFQPFDPSLLDTYKSDGVELKEVGIVINPEAIKLDKYGVSDSLAKNPLSTILKFSNLQQEISYSPIWKNPNLYSGKTSRTNETGCSNINYRVMYTQWSTDDTVFYACYEGTGILTFNYGYHMERYVYAVCPGHGLSHIHYKTERGLENWSTERSSYPDSNDKCYEFYDEDAQAYFTPTGWDAVEIR